MAAAAITTGSCAAAPGWGCRRSRVCSTASGPGPGNPAMREAWARTGTGLAATVRSLRARSARVAARDAGPVTRFRPGACLQRGVERRLEDGRHTVHLVVLRVGLAQEPGFPGIRLRERPTRDHAHGDRVVQLMIRFGPASVVVGQRLAELTPNIAGMPVNTWGRPRRSMTGRARSASRDPCARWSRAHPCPAGCRGCGGRRRGDAIASVRAAMTHALRHHLHDVAPPTERRRGIPLPMALA